LSNFLLYKLLDACRERDCPLCRVEQNTVERYIENQLYENVNSPRWRENLRSSLGFCQMHAWLAVDRRLGDALGLSIIYRDLFNSILKQMEEGSVAPHPARNWPVAIRQLPEGTRKATERTLLSITPGKRCPVCVYREETIHDLLSVLAGGLKNPELISALRSSDGICLPHFQQALEQMKDGSSCEQLLAIQREKMASLRQELDEFIRKNDYQNFQEGFGREANAWLRAVALVVGSKK
jgi:hypothetical protein